MSETIYALTYTNREGHNVVLKSCPTLEALTVSPYFYLEGFQGELVVLHPEGVELVDLVDVQVWVYQDGQAISCAFLDIEGMWIPVEEYHGTPVHYRYHLMTIRETIEGEAPFCLELYRCYRHLDEAWEDFKYLTLSGQLPVLMDRISGEPVEA